MYHSIIPGTRLYRVARPEETWPEVVQGLGAFYTEGGRYNAAHQATLYASDDPQVAITEAAFHRALIWHADIALFRTQPVSYPLRSEHSLWCFTLDPAPSVIDLQHAGALALFAYPPHLLLNPSVHYDQTRRVATAIRSHIPPSGSGHPRTEGVKAPSVRTPRSAGFQPYQYAFFVTPSLLAQHPATQLEKWSLAIEFQEPHPRRPASFDSAQIDWWKPRFKLGGPSTASVPAFPARPGARPYAISRWYRLTVNFA